MSDNSKNQDEILDKKVLEAINKIKEKSEDDFEKQLIFISSGALGISFAFIEKLVKLDQCINLGLLSFAWYSLIFCLCINLVSHYVSKHFAEKCEESYQRYCNKEIEYEQMKSTFKGSNEMINWINYSSIICLFLGLLFLFRFVTINIDHMSKQQKPYDPVREERGRTIPVPQPPAAKPVQPSKPSNPPTEKK